MNKTVLKLPGTVRESYDYVLIDLPPLGSVIDAAVVAAKCDGAILVISDHQVRCHQAVEVVDQLKKCGSRILGVVRNNIHANGSGYYKKYYKNRYQYRWLIELQKPSLCRTAEGGLSCFPSACLLQKGKILQSCTANGGVYSEENVEFTT